MSGVSKDRADRLDRCERCVYFKGVTYLGDQIYVRIKTYKGCGLFRPADGSDRQAVLF